MPTSPRRPRSIAVLLLLAATVAIASAGVAAARQDVVDVVPPAPVGLGAVEPAVSTGEATSAGSAPEGRIAAAGPVSVDLGAADDLRREHLQARVPTAAVATSEGAWITRATSDVPAAKPRTEAKGSGGASAAALTGRNKVWIPALGIRRSVAFFSCSSKAYPGNRVYRWGCAGRNNVYLFGHAHSVFKPLHDAYVRGRLKKGMKVMYADSKGRVSTYKVIWWKVTTPDKGGFAYAAQSRPSMTLQTCVGARSQYRLIVRLVKAG